MELKIKKGGGWVSGCDLEAHVDGDVIAAG
jgi:hypothetical protein